MELRVSEPAVGGEDNVVAELSLLMSVSSPGLDNSSMDLAPRTRLNDLLLSVMRIPLIVISPKEWKLVCLLKLESASLLDLLTLRLDLLSGVVLRLLLLSGVVLLLCPRLSRLRAFLIAGNKLPKDLLFCLC